MIKSTDLLLLSIGAHSAPRGQDFPSHRHDCWELVYYREGHIKAPVGDEVFWTRPGLMLLTPPGVPHSEEAQTAYSNYFASVRAPADRKWPRSISDDANGTLAYIFRSLHHEATTGAQRACHSATNNSMQELLMAQLDVFLSRHEYEQPVANGERIVREAEQVLAERFARSVVIGDVAREVQVAPSVLRAHFAERRGYSPIAALQRIRVERALALLSNSDLTLNQVASACGFHSPSHLSRHVRHRTGEAPGRWRRAGSMERL